MKLSLLTILIAVSLCACAGTPKTTSVSAPMLYSADLNLPIRPGDTLLEECRDEFDPSITFTDQELETLRCIQPATGQSRESFAYYRAALEEAGFTPMPDKKQSGLNFELVRADEKIAAIILSHRYFSRQKSGDDAIDKIAAERILTSLPIAFFYEK